MHLLQKGEAARAVQEYLARLNDAAFGAASEVTPKFISSTDPAAQWTGALKGPAFFAYATNYLIDTENAVILDVEATRAIRQAEVGASRTMLDRVEERWGLKPQWVAADSAYGSASNLAWLVKEKQIAPHIPVFSKSQRTDGTWSREDFTWDSENDRYICPEGQGAGSIPQDVCHATDGRRQGWLPSLPRHYERLLGLPVKTHLLPERAGPQDPRVM